MRAGHRGSGMFLATKAGLHVEAFLLFLLVLFSLILLHSSYAQALPGLAQFRALALVIADRGTATAFHIGRGCWISAAHVATAPVIRLVIHDGSIQGAVVSRLHPFRDVALLRGPMIRHALPLSTRPPRPREPVWAAGFPGNSRRYGQAVTMSGHIHVNTGDDGLIWIEGMAFSGHSGSPLLDGNNRVVGMVVGVHRLWLDLAVAEPTAAIVEMVRRRCR